MYIHNYIDIHIHALNKAAYYKIQIYADHVQFYNVYALK